jgi:ABC-type amino acid transport substrate-binding protein
MASVVVGFRSLSMATRGSLLVLLCGAALCAAPASAQDLPALKKTGRLRVLAVPVNEGPQFMAPDKPGEGFDAEILAGFARLHELAVEVVPVETWDGLVPALAKGRGDVIAGGFTNTAGRRAQIAFTVEVFPTRDVVLTRKPSPPITTLDQLRKAHVGTIKGTSMSDAVAAAGVAKWDNELPPGGVQAALREGRVAAAVDGLESALVATRNDPDVQIGVFVGSAQSLAYGVRKDAPELLGALNEYLINLRQSGTWNRLAVKYFGPAAPEILRRSRE